MIGPAAGDYSAFLHRTGDAARRACCPPAIWLLVRCCRGTTVPRASSLPTWRKDLLSVAKYQKGILVCILIYLSAVLAQFVVPAELQLVVRLGGLAVGIAGSVFVFLLSTKVYSVGLGVVLGLLTLIPCVGLVVLLIINGKATGILRQNGIRVGLLGADLSDI